MSKKQTDQELKLTSPEVLRKLKSLIPPTALILILGVILAFKGAARNMIGLIALIIAIAWWLSEFVSFYAFHRTPLEDSNPRYAPTPSSLKMLYRESWKEYHHTEYMIFVFLAAIAAADVTLLQARKQLLVSLLIAVLLGISAVLVTRRQNQSRRYRIDIIKRVEKELGIDRLIGKEEYKGPRLGTTLLFLSYMLFILPLVFLMKAIWN